MKDLLMVCVHPLFPSIIYIKILFAFIKKKQPVEQSNEVFILGVGQIEATIESGSQNQAKKNQFFYHLVIFFYKNFIFETNVSITETKIGDNRLKLI
jgi:hypothetical protein